MTRIELGADENLASALRRLRRKVAHQYGVRWYKKRLGYYEKPSTLERKRKKMKTVVTQSKQRGIKLNIAQNTGEGLVLFIGQKERYERNGPDNATGR